MKKIITSIAIFAPSIAFAQAITDINSLSYKLTNIGNVVIQVLIALAVIWIIFNIVRYILAADKPEERSKFGVAILWSIVGLFVILSIWGLVNILSNTFRTNSNTPTNQYPVIQYPTQVP
jgi:heme/copper-type cytochrome/quinol oxidase subunit 4